VRRADLAAGALLLALAAVYLLQSLDIERGFASDRLGPAFFPQLLGAVLAVLAVVLVIRALAGRSDPNPPPPARTGLLWAVVGLLVAYGVVMPHVGFLLATPPLLAAVTVALGLRQPLLVVAPALGITLVLYAVFGRLLGVLFPRGPLGGW
jgi:hypothetical protein